MDQASVINLSNTNLTPVAPDTIDDAELRSVFEETLKAEATVIGTNPATLNFQAAKGTIYSTTITDTTVTISGSGDVIGYRLLFQHNAASLTISGATLLNPGSYTPGSLNFIEAQVIDTGVVIARILGNPLHTIQNGDDMMTALGNAITSNVGGEEWLKVLNSSGLQVFIGDGEINVNGTSIFLDDAAQTITFKKGNDPVFVFDINAGTLTIPALDSNGTDGTPVKALGVTAAGLLVKSALSGFANYKGFHADLAALNAAHANPDVGDLAFLTTTKEWAACLTDNVWEATTLEAYDVANTTKDELEKETSWNHQNIFQGSGIVAADLVAGKRAIHRTEPGVFFECLPGSPNYWVRKGNRIPATLKYGLGATGEDATASTSVAKDTDYLEADFVLIGAEGSAGAVLPAGGGAIIDVHAAGATVFAATKVEIADGTASGSQSVTATTLAKGSKVELFIDSVPSTPGQGYKVSLIGFWKF